MKQTFVSAVALLFCGAVIGFVGLFGFTRYRAAQARNAEFQVQLRNAAAPEVPGALGAHMPAQLPSKARSASVGTSASPRGGQQ